MTFKQDYIPSYRAQRVNIKIKPTSITVHDTGNSSVGADARAHARYLKSTNRKASWHYTIDDNEIIQHIPWNEMAWHAGNAKGNSTSIGIEICMNSDGNRKKAEENAQQLIAELMKETGIRTIKKHQDWTGKCCPQVLLREGRWNSFVSGCFERLKKFEEPKPQPQPKPKKEHWAEKDYQYLKSLGIQIDNKKFDEKMTRGETFALLAKSLKKIR